jgi:competence protein ComEA
MRRARTLALALALSVPFAVPAGESADINTADAETLARVIDGIGVAKAQAIVDYRKANGPFKSVDDLTAVKGIGDRTVARNRDRLSVGAAPVGHPSPPAAPPIAAAGAPPKAGR